MAIIFKAKQYQDEDKAAGIKGLHVIVCYCWRSVEDKKLLSLCFCLCMCSFPDWNLSVPSPVAPISTIYFVSICPGVPASIPICASFSSEPIRVPLLIAKLLFTPPPRTTNLPVPSSFLSLSARLKLPHAKAGTKSDDGKEEAAEGGKKKEESFFSSVNVWSWKAAVCCASFNFLLFSNFSLVSFDLNLHFSLPSSYLFSFLHLSPPWFSPSWFSFLCFFDHFQKLLKASAGGLKGTWLHDL